MSDLWWVWPMVGLTYGGSGARPATTVVDVGLDC